MIQKLLFDYTAVSKDAPEQAEEIKALFYRGEGAASGALAVKGGAQLSFDTYFNMFSALKWKEYTAVEDIALKLCLKGRGKILVCGASLAEPDKEIVLKEEDYSAWEREEREYFRSPLSASPDFLYFKIKAEKDSLLYSGGFDGEIKSRNRVKIAACVCTYRREKELEENLRKIKEQIFEDASSPLYKSLDVYIADNGHTLKDIPFFTEAAKAHPDRLFIFENKNCGGSAGFTRCMIEAALKKDVGYTHTLLMDDDAETEPFVLERTQALLSALKEECRDKFVCVGGASLSLTRKGMQIENGGYYTFNTKENIKKNKNKIDLLLRENVILNEKTEMTNYNAWFYCCIPVKYITRNNLPLPLFIHNDDIEYSLRCGGMNDDSIVSINGICVWHLDDSSKHSEYIRYYDSRNGLILSAEFLPDLSFEEVLGNINIEEIMIPDAVNFRYNICNIWGRLDFYKGIDEFKKADGEALNAKLRKSGFADETRFKVSGEEIKKILSPSEYGHRVRVFRKLLTWALPAVRGRAYYDKDCPGEGVDYFLRRELAFVDRKTGDAVLIKKSYKKLFKVTAQYFRLKKQKARHAAVWKEWHERIGELQTLEFWEKYLELK